MTILIWWWNWTGDSRDLNSRNCSHFWNGEALWMLLTDYSTCSTFITDSKLSFARACVCWLCPFQSSPVQLLSWLKFPTTLLCSALDCNNLRGLLPYAGNAASCNHLRHAEKDQPFWYRNEREFETTFYSNVSLKRKKKFKLIISRKIRGSSWNGISPFSSTWKRRRQTHTHTCYRFARECSHYIAWVSG